MKKEITPIEKLEFETHNILNKSILLQGATGTGKSQTALFLCSLIKDYVNTVVVCCPSNNEHGDWTGVAPECCIVKEVTDKLLTDLIDSQCKISEYKKSIKENLTHFWKQISGHEEVDLEYQKNKQELKEEYEKNKKMYSNDDIERHNFKKTKAKMERDKKSRKLLAKYYKHMFVKNKLDRNACNDDVNKLKLFLKYFRMNSNMLLIIDDCSDQLKDVEESTWSNLLNKSRHWKITVLLSAHNLANIKKPTVRTAPMWYIFSDYNTCQYSLTNQTMGMKNTINVDGLAIKRFISFDKEKMIMTKIAIHRETQRVFKFTFNMLNKPKIGHPVLWKFYEKINEMVKSRPMLIDPNDI